MAKTYQEKLDEIETAITEVLTKGQSFQHGTGDGNDRTLTRANLVHLRDERARLEPLAAREARGGMRVRNAVPSQ